VNVIGMHGAGKDSAYQITRYLNSSSVLGHYHPTVLVLLWGNGWTRTLVQFPFGEPSGLGLLGLQGHNHNVSSILRDHVPPTERVIVERGVLNSKVATRIPKTLTLKPLECGPALDDIREIHNGIGVILHISGTVDRHLRGPKLSEDGFQTSAVVDNRHLPVNGTKSFIPNDGVVEIKDQDACGLQFTIPVRDIWFLTSIPVRAAPDIQSVQARLVQALVHRGDEVVICYIQTSQTLQGGIPRRLTNIITLKERFVDTREQPNHVPLALGPMTDHCQSLVGVFVDLVAKIRVLFERIVGRVNTVCNGSQRHPTISGILRHANWVIVIKVDAGRGRAVEQERVIKTVRCWRQTCVTAVT